MHPILRGFQHRNFRLFFIGQTLTMIGTWMQFIAISWLTYRLTGSAFMLGMIGFALQIPILLVSPFAGVWVDRYNRRTMLLVTQSLALAQALLLAALTFAGLIQVWHVLLISFSFGTINAVANPTRNTFLLELVESKANLPIAIALNSLIMNSTRFVGPSIADEDKRGRVISIYGMCFLGTPPLGSFVSGAVASHIGAPYTLLVFGAFGMLAAIAFAVRIKSWRAAIRPVYRRLGLLS